MDFEIDKIDRIDEQILNHLISDARMSYTSIAKKINVSAGTVNIRLTKMEKLGIIKGATLNLDYRKLGYAFISYVGIVLSSSSKVDSVVKDIRLIPNITVAHIVSGKFDIFCKVRAKNVNHAKKIVLDLSKISGIKKTRMMLSLEESINDKKRLMHMIFNEKTGFKKDGKTN